MFARAVALKALNLIGKFLSRPLAHCIGRCWPTDFHAPIGAARALRPKCSAVSGWPLGFTARQRLGADCPFFLKEKNMPVIAWLLGVPLSVVLLLMLFGVF